MIEVIAPKIAELHNCPDHKAFRAAFTKSAQEPQIEHTRHRSVTGFMVNLMAGLIAYTYQPKKPSLGLRRDPTLPMLMV